MARKRGRRRSTTRRASPKRRRVRSVRLSRLRRRASSVGSRIKRVGKKKGKNIVSMITNVIPPIASVQLLSYNQLSALPQDAPMGSKVKAILNGVTGSIMDFNLFDDVPQAHVHFDIEGAFNQWTAVAGGSWLAGIIGQKVGLPKAGLLKSFGKKLLPNAIVAGSLGLKNNNPPAGTRHTPYLSKSSNTQTQQVFTSSIQTTSNGSGIV